MSREENRGIIDAYQKMLTDGTAFKEVDITMNDTPDLAMAEGAISESLGEKLGDKVTNPEREYHNDYSEADDIMQQKINRLKSKTGSVRENKRISQLEAKVKRLEEALMIIMEQHEELMEK